MGQGFLRGQGGSIKQYTLADCSYAQPTLTLPAGVTWDDIAMMFVDGVAGGGVHQNWSKRVGDHFFYYFCQDGSYGGISVTGSSNTVAIYKDGKPTLSTLYNVSIILK